MRFADKIFYDLDKNCDGKDGQYVPWGSMHSTLIRGSLQWRHNERFGVSHHQRLECLLSRLFRRRPKKASKLRVTGLCEGNPPVTGGFHSQGPEAQKMFLFDDGIMFPCWFRNIDSYAIKLSAHGRRRRCIIYAISFTDHFKISCE